ncbi:DUF481 domain-containing protein [Thermomonas sp. S9]|nr:DUF481 domain-containing protein [Thermomonas sp. S9]
MGGGGDAGDPAGPAPGRAGGPARRRRPPARARRPRDWVKAQGSNARVGMQYGLQALQTRDTRVTLALGTGYRLTPYADDGIAGTGPILRGQLEWNQALGRYARLSQVTRLETGRHGAFLRNSLLLNVQLRPALTLSSGVELRRDRDLAGRDQTDATVKLKYAF